MIATTIKRIRARFTRTVDIAADYGRTLCELDLVDTCEIFTRCVELVDERKACPTCALIVPDLVWHVGDSGLTDEDLERAMAALYVKPIEPKPVFRSSVRILGLEQLEEAMREQASEPVWGAPVNLKCIPFGGSGCCVGSCTACYTDEDLIPLELEDLL